MYASEMASGVLPMSSWRKKAAHDGSTDCGNEMRVDMQVYI